MHRSAAELDAMLDALAERFTQWRAGSRSGGLYAQLQDAGHAIGRLPPVRAEPMRARLNAIALQIGVRIDDGTVDGLGRDQPTLACVIRVPSGCDSIEAALHDLDAGHALQRIDATSLQPATCEIWLHPAPGPQPWTRRVRDASDAIRDHLQHAFEQHRIANFVVYCVTR